MGTSLNPRSSLRRAFSLLEVVGALCLLSVIVGISLYSAGDSQGRQLCKRIGLHLNIIDSAKATWRIDHPLVAFPSDEPGRFSAIQPYVKIGLQSVSSLQELQPNANYGSIVYSINTESTPASAHNNTLSKSFNRSTQDWQ